MDSVSEEEGQQTPCLSTGPAPFLPHTCLGYTCFVPNPRVVQSLSCVRLFVTPGTAACQAPLPLTISWSLLKLLSFESVAPPNPSHPLSPSSSPARIFQSGVPSVLNSFSLRPWQQPPDFCLFQSWPLQATLVIAQCRAAELPDSRCLLTSFAVEFWGAPLSQGVM